MLSNHYPLAFATEWNWVIASLVFLMGVTIRHFFNSMHARRGRPWWTWAVTAVIFIAIMWLSTAGVRPDPEAAAARPMSAPEQVFAEAPGFEDVHSIVLGRCSMCHAREPVWDGIHWAPKGVYLELEQDIAREARQIFLQAGASHAMPPGNLTWMEPEERAAIVRWYRSATGRDDPA
jgi:uncharacterized membrane protein